MRYNLLEKFKMAAIGKPAKPKLLIGPNNRFWGD